MWVWLVLGVILIAALLYWILVITEGAYLGTRVVVRLYDWTADRYNKIKKLRFIDESYFLGIPLNEALASIREPKILDVATGTGRLPLALVPEDEFRGQIIGVDHSEKMLRAGQASLAAKGNQTILIQGDAHDLMFADAAFDAVTCLESLEFMRDPRRAVREMVRVLKPGGVLLVTNRVGWESWLFPGHYCRRGRLEALLEQEGLTEIDTHRWQVYYDLIWAVRGLPADQQPNWSSRNSEHREP